MRAFRNLDIDNLEGTEGCGLEGDIAGCGVVAVVIDGNALVEKLYNLKFRADKILNLVFDTGLINDRYAVLFKGEIEGCNCFVVCVDSVDDVVNF